MPRYIDASIMPHGELWDELSDVEKTNVLAYLLSAPTADVVERRCGKWLKLDGDWRDCDTREPLTMHQCSYCGSYFSRAPYDFCPMCGADMREL